MAGTTTVSGLRLVLEDVDLRSRRIADDLGRYGQLVESFAIGDDGSVVLHDQERRECDLTIALDALDVEDVTLLDFSLLPAGANDGVHDPSMIVVVGADSLGAVKRFRVRGARA